MAAGWGENGIMSTSCRMSRWFELHGLGKCRTGPKTKFSAVTNRLWTSKARRTPESRASNKHRHFDGGFEFQLA